ncbi:hypothetical protein ACEPAI_7144 [Sanghuangporus weigelae]
MATSSTMVRPASELFPVEIWREIIRFATTNASASSASSFPGQIENNTITFNWPHTTSSGVIDDKPCRTKHALALTSYQFWHITCEFLYETVHIRRAEHAREIAGSPSLRDAVSKWMRNLVLAPEFDLRMYHAEFSPLAKQFGEDVQVVLGCCSKLKSLVIRADAVSKRLAMYELWMKICRAVPLGVQHLDIDDDIHAPSLWEPRHLAETRHDAYLRSLRLTAVQNSCEYDLPSLTHLALYSWPIARKWTMANLTHLYITYFPNLPRTNTFWMSPKPALELLHFGYGTDLSVFPDLARLLNCTTPNLNSLEYYYYGDSEMTWDPNALPASLKRVAIKTFHHWPTGYKRGRLEIDLAESSEEFSLQLAIAERWTTFSRHLASFTVQPTILVPTGTLIERLKIAIRPIFEECGTQACFAESS